MLPYCTKLQNKNTYNCFLKFIGNVTLTALAQSTYLTKVPKNSLNIEIYQIGTVTVCTIHICVMLHPKC